MKTLEKIDEFIEKVDFRKEKETFIKEAKKDEYTASEWLKGKRKVGGPGYEKFYQEMLKKWKIKTYKDLPKPKQDEFWDDVFKSWNKKGKREGVK
jgi:hypothetical protein